MGSRDSGELVVTVQPTSETKHRVSIQSDPLVESRLGDNLAYDIHSRRKASQVMIYSQNYIVA